MSRKRTRSSKTTPKNLILINEEVKEKFDSIFKHQPMMLEKREIINALKWEQFCDAHSLPDDELVQEFYANLSTHDAIEVIA
ncbi:hypothetical protein J1N35_041588 [Gossypium stocksii]|uniref:Uncharacterized protein n=1 Tax=Gossypium stocksii TaxID=47602 RepID=A0A9D3UG57_9ROSI|nr:hypothetical protein J1N35_041588 [Gossypium stocksii]